MTLSTDGCADVLLADRGPPGTQRSALPLQSAHATSELERQDERDGLLDI